MESNHLGRVATMGRPCNMVDSIFVLLQAEELLGSQERVLQGVTPPEGERICNVSSEVVHVMGERDV